MADHAHAFAARPGTAGLLALALLLVAVGGGCSRHDAQSAAAGRAAAADAGEPQDAAPEGLPLPLREGDRPLLHPIHEGVEVRLEADAGVAAYTRARGRAFGVAYMLTPGVLGEHGAIELRMRTQPALRPQVCLTDAAGNVWNAPGVSGGAPDRLRFDLRRLQPDPFQNNGRTLPASAELGTMRMLTILDISGFMGGAEVRCEWTIEEIRLTPGDGASSSAQDTGGVR